MDQLRKVGDWLWRNKEKLVLAGLVIVLMYQVYQVKFAEPAPEEEQVQFLEPRGQVFSGGEGEALPPPPPPDPDRPDTKRIVRSNPFSAEGLGAGEVGEDGESRPDAVLVRIMPFRDGAYVAEIRTQTERAKRFGVGDEFESFKVLEIRPDTQEVVIYSEEHRSNFVLTPEE